MNRRTSVVAAAGLAAAVLLLAGCKSESTGPGEYVVTGIKANGSLAAVSRTEAEGTMFVTDQNGLPITSLAASNVTATLVWATQKISADDSLKGTVVLRTLQEAGKRIAVGLTMDYSGSMYVGDIDPATQKYRRILDMENAVKAFISAMSTGDRAQIVKFGSDVVVVQPFTTDRNALLRGVDSLSQSRGLTALYESIGASILDAARANDPQTYVRAVVAFTDGAENASVITRDSLFALSRRYGIPVYTVGLLDAALHSEPPGQNSSAERDLVQIADSTGGFYFYAPTATQLSQIYGRISGQINNAFAFTITWPSTGLPPSGRLVTARMDILLGAFRSGFSRSYIIP